MNYTCPVCNYIITMLLHEHTVGLYTAYIHFDGEAYIYDGERCLLNLSFPKRLSEKYIDMVLLLK